MKKLIGLFLLTLYLANSQISTGASTTLSATSFNNSTVITATPAAVATYTTDTAANYCLYSAGISRLFVIVNSGGGIITVAAGAGVTTSGTMTIANSTARLFIMYQTSCNPTPAWTIQSLGTFASF